MIRQGVRALREMYGLTRDLGNLRVLLLSGMVLMLAAGLLSPVLPLYLQSRGLNMQGIGWVYTVGSLLPIVVQPMMGALSDRFGRKGFIIVLSLGTSLMLPVLAWVDSPLPMAAALALKLLLGRSATPVTAALAADSAPVKQRATVFGLLDSINNLAYVVALVGSAFVMALLTLEQVFLLAGALFLVSSFVLFRLKESPRPESAAAPVTAAGALRLALDGLRSPFVYVRRSSQYAGVFAFQFFFAFALNLYPIYVPLYVTKLGLPQNWVGPMVALSWLVFALFQPVGGRLSDRLTRRVGLISAGLVGLGVLTGVMGLVEWLPTPYALGVLVAAWALLAVPDGLSRPSLPALAVELSPAAERGRFMGALGFCAAMAQGLAPVCYGFVAQRVSLGSAFLLSSGAFVLALLAISRVREPAASSLPPLHSTPSTEPG
ncbi:MFS transporter [Myxococcaceae bacterium GXIMD 01537]